jgi:hypothetical protein
MSKWISKELKRNENKKTIEKKQHTKKRSEIPHIVVSSPNRNNNVWDSGRNRKQETIIEIPEKKSIKHRIWK